MKNRKVRDLLRLDRESKSTRVPGIPILFAAVTIAAYGLLLPMTGFYWDDWPFAWLARFMGPSNFIPAFRGFRPFLGPIFYITTSLLPTAPIVWQALALLVRFAAALAAWSFLSRVWPHNRLQVVVVCLLFLVFPGYSQNWVALTHINQEWIPFLFLLLSFAFTMRALRAGSMHAARAEPAAPPAGVRERAVAYLRAPLASTIIASLLLAAGLFPTEYFIGLEPLRFLFIWVVISESTLGFGLRLRRTLKVWWPCLLVWLADAVWLFYYYKSGAYVSYDLTAARSAPELSGVFAAFGDALWKAGLYVWFQVLVLCARTVSAPTTLITLGIIIVAVPAILFYLSRIAPLPTADRTFAWSAILIGLIGILLGRVPSFAAGLPLTLQSSFDRFMISMMLPASLLVVGLVDLIPGLRFKTLLLAVLVALGIGQQFFNGNIFRRDWARQQEIYWQMAWRMPALKPDTAVITQQMPLDYETDFSMTAALNWIYAPQDNPAALPYALIYSEKRLGGMALPSLKPNTVMRLPYRTVDFNGNTSKAVVIYVAPNGCLRVLDPTLGDAETYSKYPDSVTAPIPLSDPGRILVNAPSPSLPFMPFGSEPQHAWCYFYEKAELARQAGDWQKIVDLAAQANLGGFTPQDPFEWLPFIEGYARLGNVKISEELTRMGWNQEPKLHRGLCVLWKRLQTGTPAPTQRAATQILGQLGCGQ